MKQLADRTDESEKHVEELTWKLDDAGCQQSSTSRAPISDSVRPQKKVAKTSKKFSRDLCGIAEVEGKEKVSKSHIFNDSHLQRHQTETKSSPSNSKKLKLARSPSKVAKLEKSAGNKSAMLSEYGINKLSGKTKFRSVETEGRPGGHIGNKLDSSQSAVELNGDEDQQRENGVVSFTDEAEMNDDAFASPRLSHLEQGAVYTEFESAVVHEYLDREPARNVDRFPGRQRTDHDSSDEDVFDLIASGRISKLTRRSQGCQSKYSRSPVTLHHQRDPSAVSHIVHHDPIVSERHRTDGKGDDNDSVSSADTDVIIRSHRLVSEVTSSLPNQAVGSFQPNHRSTPNIAGNFGSQDRLLNVANTVSLSRSLAEDHQDTGRKQRRKRSTGSGAEIAVQNRVRSPELLVSTAIIDDNVVPRNLPENSCSSESKQKRKQSKSEDSELTAKSDASSADNISPAEAHKSEALPVTADVDSSSIKQRKTDVSSCTASVYNLRKYCVSVSLKYLYAFTCLQFCAKLFRWNLLLKLCKYMFVAYFSDNMLSVISTLHYNHLHVK